MGLRKELGFPRAIQDVAHEAVLNILVTADLLAKEGERVVAPFGITEAQFNVLMLLRYQSEGGGLDQTALGRMLVVNRSNVTGLVDRMERAGWVVRTPDPGDRRVKQVSLTPAGVSVLEQAEPVYLHRVQDVVGSLSTAERSTLAKILGRLRTTLNSPEKVNP
jgi:DNA-binding MarR family transcriptional regulator